MKDCLMRSVNFFIKIFLSLLSFKYSKLKMLLILTFIGFFINSCAIGIGHHSILKDKANNLNKNPVFEAEYVSLLGRPAYLDTIEYFKLRAGISFSYSDLYKIGKVNLNNNKVTISLIDFRIPVRLNIIETKHFMPYVGAGLGYYKLTSNIKSLGKLINSEYIGGDYTINYYAIDNDLQTISSGIFPFIEGGITFGLSSKTQIRFSYKKDFLKKSSGIDLSGDRIILSFIFYSRLF